MVIEKWYNRMLVTLTNHDIARAGYTVRGALALWTFLQNLSAKYTVGEDQKKKILTI